MHQRVLALAAFAFLLPGVAASEEPLDLDMVGKIMNEGFNRSQVMDTVYHLTDVIGPRLTNSPGMREAAAWAKSEFESYGVDSVELEYFPFGRGWSHESVSVFMTSPRRTQLQAMPLAWHPGTYGAIEGEIIVANVKTSEDLEELDGKVDGKIVLIGEEREQDEPGDPLFRRHDEQSLAEIAQFPIPQSPSNRGSEWVKRLEFFKEALAFLKEQGAIAVVRSHYRDTALLGGTGYLYKSGDTPELPGIDLASEDFDRLVRLSKRDEPVSLSIDIKAQFYDENHDAQNVIAEIRGRGSRPGIVMAGAHLDSWFMGDGAVDNAAGSAVVMEAARILAAIDAKPKRTIRFALWDGEEQALVGSIFHVRKHFGDRAGSNDDWTALENAWPIEKGRDYERLTAYFNLDNGSGRIRGIYGEGNPSLKPIFERWFEPFHEMGAETVVLRGTSGTDHLPFRAVGLPGFQFIQDPMDYFSRLHHTNIDTASHVYQQDLKQAAIIMASFLWHAANREERLPRLPTPTKPNY